MSVFSGGGGGAGAGLSGVEPRFVWRFREGGVGDPGHTLVQCDHSWKPIKI